MFFGPFWTIERRKRAKKKVNRQTPDKKNYRQNKLTNAGFVAEKNHGCTIIFAGFFVATQYKPVAAAAVVAAAQLIVIHIYISKNIFCSNFTPILENKQIQYTYLGPKTNCF